MKHKVLTILLTVSVFLFVLTAAICVPILFRPFYYWQIKPLNIESYSGFDYQTIRTAFDDLMYCSMRPFKREPWLGRRTAKVTLPTVK